MTNQLFVIDATEGWKTMETEQFVEMEKLLNEGLEVKRCYTTDKVFIFHIAKPEPEELIEEPVVESVIEVALDDNPDTVKAYTDDGWVVREYYSKRVQLVKHKEVSDE